MRIPKLAIENHQFTIIVVLALVASGIVSFFLMPRTEDPPVSPPGASVIVLYPGANPVDLEELVTDPIEKSLNELDDIKILSSSIKDGLSVTGIEFTAGCDPDEKYSDVVQKVNSIRSQLPEDIWTLKLTKWEVSSVNILQIALTSDSASYKILEKEAERLENRLDKVSNVRRVETWAYPEQEIRISLNSEKMARMRISIQQITQAIQSANMNIPGGSLDLGGKRFNLQTSGNYQSLEEIQNTIIHSNGASVVYLKDIADVSFDYADPTYMARYSGERAVFVTLTQKAGSNIFTVMEGLENEIANFKEQLPRDIELHYVFNQSESVAHRLNSFFSNLIQGVILVGLVMLFSLSFRAALIVMLAIPISIMIGIGFIDFSGYGLQQMTIAGLVIVLGILVDNAIVVTENVSRFIKMGKNFKDAAIEGTEQIGWAIVSATVTTILAFVPMMMMRDVTGEFIRSMPLTVVYTLTASLFVALTLTPYLSSKLLKRDKIEKENKAQILFNSFVEGPYRKTLNFALNHRLLVLSLTLIVFLSSFGLFGVVGVSFFPKAEKPQFIINIETPEGTNLDKTDQVAKDVESVLKKRNEIRHFATNVGRGNPRIYYNVIERNETSTYAQIFIQLKNNDLDEMTQIIKDLRNEFGNYAGAKIEVKELEQGPPVDAPISIRVLGENLDELTRIAADVEKIIASTDGTINVYNPLATSKTDLHININRDKAGLYGVPIAVIDQTVRASVSGMAVSKYRDSVGKEYDIVLRLPVNSKTQLSDLDKIYVNSAMGTPVPLMQLANLEFKASPQSIRHFNLDRSVTITSDVVGDYSVNETTLKILEKLDKYELPKDYRFYIGGEHESQEESFGGMLNAIIIAMLGIFAVLVLQFRSFSQPIIVFAAIPLAVIGSVLALLITGNSFSFTAFVGLTSLVGIVVNNSIILVDYTNQLRQQGIRLVDALKEAGETRFRPIILTTGTTIGGLLPLTLRGGTLWAPMGWTIIGGLTVSTFLTLIIVPVLYQIFTKD